MSSAEVISRLQRIYAAVDAIVEGDLTKFAPTVFQDDQRFAVLHEFSGGLTPAEIENLAQSVIANIASLHDHLRGWTRRNGHDPNRISDVLATSLPLRIIYDLWNNDKHGIPTRPGALGRSEKAPRLIEIRRTLRLTTGPVTGSAVAMTFSPLGPIQVAGTGSAQVVITGQVVDAQGSIIGDLYDLEIAALEAWECELTSLGVLK
jgi:hypothetical protein